MPLSKEHYGLVRNHFIKILGGKCSCGEFSKEKLHLHHPTGTSLENGDNNSYQGRGKFKRMWEWFEAYANGNLEIQCIACHKTIKQK